MNLYDYFKEKIKVEKINDFEGDIRELALVRYVMKEASSIFYRDYTFFLNKENIADRSNIYNKKIELTDIQDFSIVCNSYCDIIRGLLKRLYEIESEIIFDSNDEFKHIDLLIKTKNGKRYIVDPLTDLVEMQTSLRTHNFASRQYYESRYSKKLNEISFLTEEELEQIDDKIGYKNGEDYLDDFLKKLRKDFDNFESFLIKNQNIAISLLGEEYDGRYLSNDEKIGLKIKYIRLFLNNRRYLNGFVEFVIFTDIVINILFSKEEKEKIKINSFFVDADALQDKELQNILSDTENRKRGIVISFNGKNYIFTLNPKTLEYDNKKWEEIVRENNIFIKNKYFVQSLKYLKDNGADRNILHNNEFLRLFSKFETALLNEGKSLEDIQNENIYIQGDTILTKFRNKYISYKIEEGHLIVKDYKENIKYIVFYEDEGRKIFYKTEPILKESEEIYLHEFDSNGLIELTYIDGIEDLVSPLNSGKYLSRNQSYYSAETYTKLAQKRRQLRSILTEDFSKRNFVILEYLSNSSAKVYFEELKKKVQKKENRVTQARKCLEEDCKNIVRIFQKRPLLKPVYDLPEGDDEILERHIEMDNKQILYLFCSNLKFSKSKHVLTPGLGSIFVGPILKAMYGFDYTNILFSLYSNDEKLRQISEQNLFDDLFGDDTWKITPNELLLIDDNVGSCNTMNTIRKKLAERGKKCKFGAIKYNWDFYNQVKHGELDHPTFNVKDVDFLTILDDPGYWIMRDSIKALKEKGGDDYVQVMKKEGLYRKDIPDILLLKQLAEKYSKSAGIDLYDMDSGNIKKSSAFLCRKLSEQIMGIVMKAKIQEESRDE